MATFNPRKFTNPDWLNTISNGRLIAFLSPWRTYLASRGFNLPPDDVTNVDHAAIARVLMTPDASSPPAMIDALYYIHETSSHEDMEELYAKVVASGLTVPDEPEVTPADYAIEVWFADPNLIHERHAESVALGQQNFEYYAGQLGRRRTFPNIDDTAKLRIQGAFDDWFAQHRRGRGCRLFVFRHSPRVWLLIRHGLPMRREASHGDDGNVGTEFYRPQHHDVLTYDETTDEMGVHAETK